MCSSYAKLFVGYVERYSFERLTASIPDFFGRFIDDCSSKESHSRTDLERFINFVHDFHPVLSFSWKISETCVLFLDILVSINGDTLRTLMFYKPINSYRYLLFSYCHPNHIKKSIPYSQFLSLDHLCSDDRDFDAKSAEMKSFFVKYDYPTHLLDSSIKDAGNVLCSDT